MIKRFWVQPLNLFCSSPCKPLLATLPTLYNLGLVHTVRFFSEVDCDLFFAHDGLYRSWWCCSSRIVWVLGLGYPPVDRQTDRRTTYVGGEKNVRCEGVTRLVIYQIVVYGGRHFDRCSVSPEMSAWLHLINSVTVDWTGGSGTRSACALYQITVVYGGCHFDRCSLSPEMFVWLHLINPLCASPQFQIWTLITASNFSHHFTKCLCYISWLKSPSDKSCLWLHKSVLCCI